MANILFFFTASFPYGRGETFIENEINYLAAKFDRVVIVSNNCVDTECRKVPANCIVERMPYELNNYQKIASVGGVFSKLFWSELTIIRKHYKIPVSAIIVKTMLLTLKKSIIVQKKIKSLTKQYSQSHDHVFYYTYWANDTAFAIAQFPEMPNCKKKISRAHGWDVYFEVNDAQYLPFRKYILEHLDSLFVISSFGQGYYQTRFPSLKSKIDVARLGVERQTQTPAKNEIFRIVSCSNMIALKRINLIVEALSYVQNSKIEWIHFGDGQLFDEIKNKCHKTLTELAITFNLKGNLANREILEFYRQNYVDCFINVSSSEGIPVSIMEAMSFSIPVIATAVGGTPEIVNNQNGYLIDKNISAQDLAKIIEQFYNLLETEKREMRIAAYNTWNKNYNAEKNYTEFANYLISNK